MAQSEGPGPEPEDGSVRTPSYPLLTNQPVEVNNPIRKIRILAVIWALAIVVASTVGAYTATVIANRSTERHVAALLAEMNRRTADRRANEVVAARILEQNRRTLCELLVAHDGTPKIVLLRKAYSCGTADTPLVPPGWVPPPNWPPLPGTAGSPKPTSLAPSPVMGGGGTPAGGSGAPSPTG